MLCELNGRKEMFYLTAQHGLLFPLAAKVLLYAPSHRQDSISRGALAGTRNSSMGELDGRKEVF